MLEVHGCVSVANDLGLEPPATTAFLHEVLAAVELTRKLQGHIQELLTDLGGFDLPFLIPREIFLTLNFLASDRNITR
jgi:hypothetical protein